MGLAIVGQALGVRRFNDPTIVYNRLKAEVNPETHKQFNKQFRGHKKKRTSLAEEGLPRPENAQVGGITHVRAKFG